MVSGWPYGCQQHWARHRREDFCETRRQSKSCYKDLWLTDEERKNAAFYCIQSENAAKIRLGPGDTAAATQPDALIASAFGNRFAISLDLEILTDHGPFYQAGLTAHELTFNDYDRVIRSTNTNATYQITNDIVTNQT